MSREFAWRNIWKKLVFCSKLSCHAADESLLPGARAFALPESHCVQVRLASQPPVGTFTAK